MSHQSPWDAFRPQDPRQGQGQPQYPPQPMYRQQQDRSPYPPQQPYQQPPQPALTSGPQYAPPFGDPRYQGPPQQPYQQPPYGRQPPPAVPPRGHRAGQVWQSWPWQRKALTIIGGIFGLFVLIAAISGAAHGGTPTKAVADPGPTVTVTQAGPAVTVTRSAPAVTVTKTVTVKVTPTANAQGEATQISADGVYVIGQDIPGGTWHTSGGSQCYEATLASTDTSNIIDNNNFTGPDTVSLAGAKAFQIIGGCTWQQEG
jgi:predicted RecA/RadA family phage recombinase